jgi:hypothetical protein
MGAWVCWVIEVTELGGSFFWFLREKRPVHATPAAYSQSDFTGYSKIHPMPTHEICMLNPMVPFLYGSAPLGSDPRWAVA